MFAFSAAFSARSSSHRGSSFCSSRPGHTYSHSASQKHAMIEATHSAARTLSRISEGACDICPRSVMMSTDLSRSVLTKASQHCSVNLIKFMKADRRSRNRRIFYQVNVVSCRGWRYRWYKERLSTIGIQILVHGAVRMRVTRG